MATTIKSTRVVKTYEYEGDDYKISGDYTTAESGNVISVSGNITKGSAQVGTFNAYDYADSGELKVNVSGVDIADLTDVVAACNDFVSDIKTQKGNGSDAEAEENNPAAEYAEPEQVENE